MVFNGSGTMLKTGPGYFNNFSLSGDTNAANPRFTGKIVVNQGTLGIFYGSDEMLGPAPTTFVPDLLTINNNAVVKTLQNQTSKNFLANRGITIGSGGATFFFASSKD